MPGELLRFVWPHYDQTNKLKDGRANATIRPCHGGEKEEEE